MPPLLVQSTVIPPAPCSNAAPLSSLRAATCSGTASKDDDDAISVSDGEEDPRRVQERFATRTGEEVRLNLPGALKSINDFMASELTAEERESLAQYKEHVGNPLAKGTDVLFRVGSYEDMRATVQSTSARNMLHDPAYNFRPGELRPGVPSQWVGADVVDCFVYVMNQKAAADGRKAFYLFTDAWAAINNNGFSMGKLCPGGITNLDDLYIPIPSQGHYTLIHVKVNDGAAWWYDSTDAGEIDEDKRKRAESFLRQYFAHHAAEL